MHIGENKANMAMCYPSKIAVYSFRVGLNLILKLVENFEGGLDTDVSKV